MISKLILFLLPVATMGQLAGGFNYDRCDATFGPSKWPGKCNMHSAGSPIDICGAVPFPGAEPTLKLSGYTTPKKMNVNNDGVNVYMNFMPGDTRPMLSTTTSLAFLVNRTSIPDPQSWVLQNVHIHWGRKWQCDEGSEHYLEGKQYAGEVHMVHYNSRFANASQATMSGAPDALLVVGLLLEAEDCNEEPATITAFADAVSYATKMQKPLDREVRFSDLFAGQKDFYAYAGSLATPPMCAEIVTWIVLGTPRKIRLSSLEKLWKASTNPGQEGAPLISAKGNYRPLQARGTRPVYTTKKCSKTCRAAQEPLFECPK